MKRKLSRPIILTLPTYEMHTVEMKPRILPFPNRGTGSRAASKPSAPAEPDCGPSEADLCAVRDRLFRMIVANQWNRSHGHRAS